MALTYKQIKQEHEDLAALCIRCQTVVSWASAERAAELVRRLPPAEYKLAWLISFYPDLLAGGRIHGSGQRFITVLCEYCMLQVIQHCRKHLAENNNRIEIINQDG